MSPRRIVLPFCLLSSVAFAAEAPVTIQELTSDTEIAADATSIQVGHYVFRANNAPAARGIAEQTIAFSERIETIEVVEAATLKADGRHLPVDLSKIVTQLQPGVANMPLYGDLKRLVIIYPDVGAGDGISLTWRRRVHHPLMPGTWSSVSTFARTVPFADARFSVTVPAEMNLAVDDHGVPAEHETHDGKTVWRWHYSADAVSEDPSSLLPIDRVPRVFVSSLPGWDALGHVWASLVADKVTVTPRIQALADRLTEGTTDRREQAKRLYDWVSTNIRWVAIYIGNGTIVPHDADEVLANGYGDCKDQVMLLVALMHTKGLAAEPVLINHGNSYTLPGAAVVGAFTHCITYFPEWDIYADTTAGGAPFGTLPFADYGKPVVHAVAEGAVVHTTPLPSPDLATMTLSTKARLDPAGEVTGESVTTAAGPYATVLRGIAARAQQQGTERFAAKVMRERDGGGTGDVRMDSFVPVNDTYHISGTFRLAPQPGWLDGDSFTLPTGLRVMARPADGLAGPMEMRELPVTEPTPCYAGQQEETLALQLPEGHTPDRLPRDRDIAGEGFHYTSHYAFDNGTIMARRRFVSTFAEPLCRGTVRASVARAFDLIRRDLEARFTLETAK